MLKLFSSISLLFACLYLGNTRIGPLPSLLDFLDPAHGVWIVSSSANQSESDLEPVAGLSNEVQIIYDKRQVPHIYAETIRWVI